MLLGPRKGTRFSAPQGHLAVPRGWRFCAGAGLGGTHAWGSGAEGRGALGEGDREGASVVLKAGLAGPDTQPRCSRGSWWGRGLRPRPIRGLPTHPAGDPGLGDYASFQMWPAGGAGATRKHAHGPWTHAFTYTCAYAHGAHTRTQNSTWSWPEPARAQREGRTLPRR